MLSQELWKTILEFTSVCTIRIMDTILLEETCEMGERIAFDEQTDLMKYRPVSRIFADSILEMITSVSIPQDISESRSGRMQNLLLSRPVALQKIELLYPSDRLLQPCPLDNNVWEQLALCNNLKVLTVDQNSHLCESNLRILSEKNGHKLLSLTFCCDISSGILNLLPDLFPNLEVLELQAKSSDQLLHSELSNIPIMSNFKFLKCLKDKDAEVFRSTETIRSLAQLPSLLKFHIGENENFLRKKVDGLGNDFSLCLCEFAQQGLGSPIQKLEELHITGSYLLRGDSLLIDDSLESLSRTFTNLRVLSIRYASCLLSRLEVIQSLSCLTVLETLDLRKSEIAVLKHAYLYPPNYVPSWCDESLPYFPRSLKNILIETEATTQNMMNSIKESVEILRSKIFLLENVLFFRCEVFPTFSRCNCRSWYQSTFNRVQDISDENFFDHTQLSE